jgi:hypothetical protein
MQPFWPCNQKNGYFREVMREEKHIHPKPKNKNIKI